MTKYEELKKKINEEIQLIKQHELKLNEIKEENDTELTEYICMDEIEGYDSVKDYIKKGEELLEKGNTEYINAKIQNEF